MLNEVISQNSIFHKLSVPERKELIDKFTVYESKYGAENHDQTPFIESDPYLFKKNDIGTMFFVIKKGKV